MGIPQLSTVLYRLAGRPGRSAAAGAFAMPPIDVLIDRAVAALPEAEGDRLDKLLAVAANGQRPALRRAAAAGRTAAELAELAEALAALPAGTTARRLALFDADPGPLTVDGRPVAQFSDTTCGSMSIVALRAITDPVYGWWLTGGDGSAFADRLAAEQRATLRRTNRIWPGALGTTPWGLTREVNRRVAPYGVRYRWRVVDDTDPAGTATALSRARAAADGGYPVPMLIGAVVPRHWVMLLRTAGEMFIFYQPSGGRIVAIGGHEFARLGFPHLQAVVVPGAVTGATPAGA